ncbi:MAG: hypothetical protein ACE5DI_04610 [Candidatus Micrarchaeia archaeon]
MAWYVFAFIAMFCFAASALLLKLVASQPFSLQRLADPSFLVVLIPQVLVSLLGAIALYLAMQQSEARVGPVMAIASLNIALVVVGDYFFFGEALALKQLAAIGLALVAILILVL